jgi:hypothetical protein
VPQGSVLGPSLFLFYINDLAEELTSKVRLFADDTIAYLAIKSEDDSITLQEDLNKLAKWESNWQMKFHPSKCQVIRITGNRRNVQHANYHVHGHTLEVVDSCKYLGVTISKDLSWNNHIEAVTSKANKSLAFLRRNLKISSPALKSTAFKALIRPHLEYASTVWDPHTIKNISKLEAVQRRAARWALNKYRYGPNTTPVTSMVSQLNWTPLSDRRKTSRLILLYKIVNGMVLIEGPPYLKPISHNHHTRYKKDHSIAIPDSTTNYHAFSFYPRTVRDWNLLPHSIVSSNSLNIFKSKLSKFTP